MKDSSVQNLIFLAHCIALIHAMYTYQENMVRGGLRVRKVCGVCGGGGGIFMTTSLRYRKLLKCHFTDMKILECVNNPSLHVTSPLVG